jgi:hypothetical protein
VSDWRTATNEGGKGLILCRTDAPLRGTFEIR